MPPHSLKFRLLLSFLVAMTLVLTGGNIAIYKGIQQHLEDEHDSLLRQRLFFYETTVDITTRRGTVITSLRLSTPEWEQISVSGNPDLVMGWRVSDGEIIIPRSPALRVDGKAHNLPRLPAKNKEIVYDDWTTWDGRPARLCSRVFIPMKETPSLPDIPVQVVVGRDLLALNETLNEVFWFLVRTVTSVMLAVLIVSAILIHRGVKPLVTLARQIEKRPPTGDTNNPFSLPGAPLELQPVVGRLNALMGRVAEAIEHERQFANNAAHELRNPLAAIRSTVEVTLSRNRSSEEYEEALDTVWQSQQGMQRIVDHLLLLARLESGHHHTEFIYEPVSLSKILKKAWRNCFENASEKKLNVTWHVKEPPTDLRTAASLIEIVISNVLDNAVNYTRAGGTIDIYAGAEGDTCHVRVENTNPGLTPAMIEESFSPFWRADPNASGHQGNAGIGLALCRRIATTIGGKMDGRITELGLVCYSFEWHALGPAVQSDSQPTS